jgi:hypothetical protein
MWNVPTILRATDSDGNILYTNSDGVAKIHPHFYVGDIYTVYIELDPSFAPSEYAIRWLKNDSIPILEYANNASCTVTFSNSDVSESWSLICEVTSNRNGTKRVIFNSIKHLVEIIDVFSTPLGEVFIKGEI